MKFSKRSVFLIAFSALELSCASIKFFFTGREEVKFPIHNKMRNEYGIESDVVEGWIRYYDANRNGILDNTVEIKEVYPGNISKGDALRAYWAERRRLEGN